MQNIYGNQELAVTFESFFVIGNPGKISQGKYNIFYLRNGRLQKAQIW